MILQQNSHATPWSGKESHRSSQPSRREDVHIEEPVACRYASAFHFYPTLPGMLGAALIWDEGVQVGEPREKRLLAPAWMVKPFHREQFPLDGIVRLI